MSFVVAIDGPTSSGKSTLAKIISKELGFTNIQTGAMYRSVAKILLDNNIQIIDIEKISEILGKLDFEFRDTEDSQLVIVNGKDVTSENRTKEVTDFTSEVASIQQVRERLTQLQRNMAQKKNIVMEGRDIGTSVFPNADIKFFLMANANVRIQRKIKELRENGEDYNYQEVAESVYKWDKDAIYRSQGALKRAPDAICIDTSTLTIDDMKNIAINQIIEKQKQIKSLELEI